MIDKLNLMTRERLALFEAACKKKIDPEEIVLEDVIQLSAGEQVPSDAIALRWLCRSQRSHAYW